MSPLLSLVIPAATAALIAFALTPVVSRFAVLIGAVDMPGERKIHHRPIPRLGGLAVVSAIALVWYASYLWPSGGWTLSPELTIGLGIGILPVLAVSIVDDVMSMKAGPKFVAHFVGAGIAVAAGVHLGGDVHLFGATIHLGWFALPLSMLWIVGVTNAFNIIDGLDGLSAGLALIAALGMAAVFIVVGQTSTAIAVLVLAGALAGFLPYNLHPARLFLGDTGATAIGFCLATFALKGGSTLSSGFAALLPIFILGLPIADTLISMARRVVTKLEDRRGGVFVADRNHIHHRLLAHGIDHGRAVLILYAAGLIFAAAAFISMFLKAREASLFVVGLLLAGFVGVNRLGYDEFAFIRRGTVLRIYEAPVVKRAMFVVFVDIALAALASYLAIGLKADAWGLSGMRAPLLELAGMVVPLTVLVFWKAGLYRGSWRVAGVDDLMRVCGAAAAVGVLALVLHLLLAPLHGSYTVFLIYGLVNVVLVTGSRASYVVLLSSQRRASNHGTPVLVYGAGRRGSAGVRELFDAERVGLRPVGFIDDDPHKVGKTVNGLPVFGTESELGTIIRLQGAGALLLATGGFPADRAERVRETCERAGISMFKLDFTLEPLHEGSSAAAVLEPAPVPAPVPAPAVVPAHAAASAMEDLAVIGAQPCQECGSRNVHRSKARSLYERFKKLHTAKRLYRCHECGWRGWLMPLEYAPIVKAETEAEVGDLRDLDDVERPTRRRRRTVVAARDHA